MAKQEPAIEIPDVKRRQPELPVRCGDCLFITRYHTYGMPCDQFGTVPSSVPCARFTPDPSLLGDARVLRDVLQVIARARSPALITMIMLGNRRVKRQGYAIGDVAYFRVMGAEFLGNYAFGVITGATGDSLVISGAYGFVAIIKTETCMTRDKWETHKASLISRERINDPNGGLRRITVRGATRLLAYEPPQIEAARRKSRGPRSTFGGKKVRKAKANGPITLSGGDVR